MTRKTALAACAAVALAGFFGQVEAQEVRIAPGVSDITFEMNGRSYLIERDQDQSARLSGEFTKTSRACPPFCIQPISAAPGVEIVGELEVMDFLQTTVSQGTGLLIDSRVPEWYNKGTIPGAVNVPFSTLADTNPYRDDILKALGARDGLRGLDYTDALELMLFCNGPWCAQSPRAIKNLIAAGYPAEKIKYYRGGVQVWLSLGLTVHEPQNQG